MSKCFYFSSLNNYFDYLNINKRYLVNIEAYIQFYFLNFFILVNKMIYNGFNNMMKTSVIKDKINDSITNNFDSPCIKSTFLKLNIDVNFFLLISIINIAYLQLIIIYY